MMKINKQLTVMAFLAFMCGMFSQIRFDPTLGETIYIDTAHASQTKLRVGKASWYSKKSPGINYRTANNEVFNDREMTCAMWGVPFNQRIRVTNMSNGKSVIVRVNDRGPHKRFVRKGRIIDLTKNAFRRIAPLQKGLIRVEIEML